MYFIDVYKGEDYPSNEKQFTELYFGKFWKISDAKIIEMSVNGITMDDNDLNKKMLNDLITNDGFTIYKYDTTNEYYWGYSQSFDSELNEDIYTVSTYDIVFDENEKKYNLKQKFNDEDSYFVKNGEFNETIHFKSYNSLIKSISSDKVIVRYTVEIFSGLAGDDSETVKAVIEITSKITQPSNLNRYNEDTKDPSKYQSIFNWLDEDDI